MGSAHQEAAFVDDRSEYMPELQYGGFQCFRIAEEGSPVLGRHGFDDEVNKLVGVEDCGHYLGYGGRGGGSSRVGRLGPECQARHIGVLRVFGGVENCGRVLVCRQASLYEYVSMCALALEARAKTDVVAGSGGKRKKNGGEVKPK